MFNGVLEIQLQIRMALTACKGYHRTFEGQRLSLVPASQSPQVFYWACAASNPKVHPHRFEEHPPEGRSYLETLGDRGSLKYGYEHYQVPP